MTDQSVDKGPLTLEASDWTESNGSGMRTRRAYLPASDPRSFQSLWRAQGGGDLDIDIPDWREQVGLERDESESVSRLIPVPYLQALDHLATRSEALFHMLEAARVAPATSLWAWNNWKSARDLYEKLKAL